MAIICTRRSFCTSAAIEVHILQEKSRTWLKFFQIKCSFLKLWCSLLPEEHLKVLKLENHVWTFHRFIMNYLLVLFFKVFKGSKISYLIERFAFPKPFHTNPKGLKVVGSSFGSLGSPPSIRVIWSHPDWFLVQTWFDLNWFRTLQ